MTVDQLFDDGAQLLRIDDLREPVGLDMRARRTAAGLDQRREDILRDLAADRAVAHEVEKRTGIESRAVTLGHVQRGGSPNTGDRVLATMFGAKATELLLAGASNRMVAMHQGAITDIDITEPAKGQRTIPADDPLLAAARGCYTSFGDMSPEELAEGLRGSGRLQTIT